MIVRKSGLILVILVSAALITGLVAALDQTVLSTGESTTDSSVKIETANTLWMTAGGITAFPETPANIAGAKRYGWGFEGKIKPNLKCWIHISPSVIYGSSVDAVELDYWLGTGAKITMIDVWDGKDKIFHWAGDISGTGTDAVATKYFPSHSVKYGVTICVLVEGGPVQANNKFIIRGAQARINKDIL